jgi:hypothetical protein
MFANIGDSNKLIADLADSNVLTKIGQWTIVWGSVIYDHDPKSQVWDNIMCVAKGQNLTTNNPQYVVAITATNPQSVFEWLQEDVNTHNRVLWSGTNPEQYHVYEGTNTG